MKAHTAAAAAAAAAATTTTTSLSPPLSSHSVTVWAVWIMSLFSLLLLQSVSVTVYSLRTNIPSTSTSSSTSSPLRASKLLLSSHTPTASIVSFSPLLIDSLNQEGDTDNATFDSNTTVIVDDFIIPDTQYRYNETVDNDGYDKTNVLPQVRDYAPAATIFQLNGTTEEIMLKKDYAKDRAAFFDSYDKVHWNELPISLAADYDEILEELVEDSFLQYSIFRPDVYFTGQALVHEETVAAVLGNQVDLAFSSAEAAEMDSHPDVEVLPIAAVGTIFITNLPGIADNQVAFNIEVACRILLGNITNWSDPALVALNPTRHLPDHGIYVVLPNQSNGCSLSISNACYKYMPTQWNATFGLPSSKLPWPRHRYWAAHYEYTFFAVSAYILHHPYALAFNTFGSTVRSKATKIAMINPAGKKVHGDGSSLQFAMIEKLIVSSKSASHELVAQQDLSLAHGDNAWPIAFTSYMYVPITLARTTCRTKAELMKYLIWMLDSPMMETKASYYQFVLLPDHMDSLLRVTDKLSYDFYCEHDLLNSVNKRTLDVFGSEIISYSSNLVPVFFDSFNAGDHVYHYKYTRTNERTAVESLLEKTTSLAFVKPDTYRYQHPGLLEYLTNQETGEYELEPFAVYSIVPTVALFPTEVQTLRALDSKTNKYETIRLDLETIALIYLGEITKWTDARIAKFSPQLVSAYRNTSVDDSISVVFCCEDPTRDHSLTNSFFLTLNSTQAFQRSGMPPLTLPPNWSYFISKYESKGMKYSLIDDELQLEEVAGINPGALTYSLLSSPEPDTKSSIIIVEEYVDSTGQRMNIDVSPAAADVLQCLLNLPSDKNDLHILDYISSTRSTTKPCHPFLAYQAVLRPRNYYGHPCAQGTATLELLEFLMESESVAKAAMSKGMIELSDVPQVASLIRQSLENSLCDGENILINVPKVWSVNLVLYDIGIILTCVGYAICIVSTFLYLKYRKSAVVRSGSFSLSLLMLSGLYIFFALPAIVVQPISDNTCSAFLWIASLGFTVRFAPNFCRMFRIFMIFGRQQLRVVRITDTKLGMIFLGLLVIDFVLLGIQQSVSPMFQDIRKEYSVRNNKPQQTNYAQCSFHSDAYSILCLLFGFKGAMLLFGVYVGYRTRNVNSRFNETKNVALSLYNLLFTCVLLIGVIFITDAHGDFLVGILLIVVFWVPFCSFLLTCVPKFAAIYADEKAAKSATTKTTSEFTSALREDSASFLFPSLESIHKLETLDRYIKILERELRHAKKRYIAEIGVSNKDAFATVHTGNTALTRSRQNYRRNGSRLAEALSQLPDNGDIPRMQQYSLASPTNQNKGERQALVRAYTTGNGRSTDSASNVGGTLASSNGYGISVQVNRPSEMVDPVSRSSISVHKPSVSVSMVSRNSARPLPTPSFGNSASGRPGPALPKNQTLAVTTNVPYTRKSGIPPLASATHTTTNSNEDMTVTPAPGSSSARVATLQLVHAAHGRNASFSVNETVTVQPPKALGQYPSQSYVPPSAFATPSYGPMSMPSWNHRSAEPSPSTSPQESPRMLVIGTTSAGPETSPKLTHRKQEITVIKPDASSGTKGALEVEEDEEEDKLTPSPSNDTIETRPLLANANPTESKVQEPNIPEAKAQPAWIHTDHPSHPPPSQTQTQTQSPNLSSPDSPSHVSVDEASNSQPNSSPPCAVASLAVVANLLVDCSTLAVPPSPYRPSSRALDGITTNPRASLNNYHVQDVVDEDQDLTPSPTHPLQPGY